MRFDPTEVDTEEERLLAAIDRAKTSPGQKFLKRTGGTAKLIHAMRAAIPTNKVEVVTLSENEGKNGYELRFPGPIDKATSALLGDAGWRFLPNFWKDPLWYRRRSPESRAFAVAFVTERNGQVSIRDDISQPPETIEARRFEI